MIVMLHQSGDIRNTAVVMDIAIFHIFLVLNGTFLALLHLHNFAFRCIY